LFNEGKQGDEMGDIRKIHNDYSNVSPLKVKVVGNEADSIWVA
jgi:hypothetical protein